MLHLRSFLDSLPTIRALGLIGPWSRAWFIGIFAWLASSFLFSPSLWLLLGPGGGELSRIPDFLALCRNPLDRTLAEPILAYRITTPLFCWLLQLPAWACLAVPYVALVLSMIVLARALLDRVSNEDAALITIGVALGYAVIWSNTKPGVPDGVTHLAVALCMLTPSPWMALAMTVLGTMNDERFLLAVPFVLLWHASPRGTFLAAVSRTWRPVVGYVSGLVIVLLVRNALTAGVIGPGIEQPETYAQMETFASRFVEWAREWWLVYMVNVAQGWRGMWVAYLAALVVLYVSGARWWLVLSGAGTMLAVLSTSLVADVSRSVGFFFPALVAVVVAALREKSVWMRRFLILGVVLCVIVPAFYLADHRTLHWARPLPLSLLRLWGGWDLLDLLR
jgi:hypothetical protein